MSLSIHFYVGIPGPTLDRATKDLLREVRPGGIILFGRNVKTPQQLARLTHELRNILGSDLFICLDHEGGRVNRLKELVGVVPSAHQLGFLGERSLAYKHGQLTGRLLSEFGVNQNLAPVLDLLLRPNVDNSVPDRTWGRDPNRVSRLAGEFVHGMQREGVLGCGKHFLGYGAADKDPHLVLPRVDRTRTQILKEDLVPYKKLVPKNQGAGKLQAQGIHMIMLSHAHLRAFHGSKLTPALISPIVNGELLRGTLGFKGVTITDDLEMGAITRTMSIGKATVECLDLGTDLILICHTAKAIREGFYAARKCFGEDPRHPALKSSVERIQQMKQSLKPTKRFSEKRFGQIKKDLSAFTRKIFSMVPPQLRVIDQRWGAIGEKY